MAGRLSARTFYLPLAGIACHGLISLAVFCTVSPKLVVNMSFRQASSRRQRRSRLRQRRDRTFFEALEGCADRDRLTVRPRFTYSPPVVAVCFGHLYQDGTDQRGIESLVWQAIFTQLPVQLIAMDPQRLGSPTAAYDLHFQEQFLQQKHDLSSKGFLTVEYMGKRDPPQDHLACGLSDCLSSVGRQFNSRFFGTWYMS